MARSLKSTSELQMHGPFECSEWGRAGLSKRSSSVCYTVVKGIRGSAESPWLLMPVPVTPISPRTSLSWSLYFRARQTSHSDNIRLTNTSTWWGKIARNILLRLTLGVQEPTTINNIIGQESSMKSLRQARLPVDFAKLEFEQIFGEPAEVIDCQSCSTTDAIFEQWIRTTQHVDQPATLPMERFLTASPVSDPTPMHARVWLRTSGLEEGSRDHAFCRQLALQNLFASNKGSAIQEYSRHHTDGSRGARRSKTERVWQSPASREQNAVRRAPRASTV